MGYKEENREINAAELEDTARSLNAAAGKLKRGSTVECNYVAEKAAKVQRIADDICKDES